MNKYKELYIKNYLLNRGWSLEREGNMFSYYSPPTEMGLPIDYRIEIPRLINKRTGFDNYISNLINEIAYLFPNESNIEDLKILFSKENSILKYRIFDADNREGSISFQKHLESLEGFKKVLSKAVIFTATNKPIFGEAKFEVDSYLNRCRSLQTEKGSFVTRLEIPNDTIYSSVSKIDTADVNNKLFDTIEYIDNNIFDAKNIIVVNENYIQDISNILNYELFYEIKNLYFKTKINNIEYQLSSRNKTRKVETERVQNSIPFFNKYLRDLKDLLMEVIPLEAVGFVKKLSSLSPLNSTHNEIILDAEISGNRETIKIILRSDEYIEAIEAHKNEWLISVKGKARQSKNMLIIKELKEFKVLKI
ncbi:hypothetical protein [Cellulophaga sp. Asnod2-G02]|uniref:hypothetical protein n=1 Tax=Cellulophaga sp. Asnod2-G02 TaxID=3160572 RepID=UPI0038679523